MRWPLGRSTWRMLAVLLAAAAIGLAIAHFSRSVMERAAAMSEHTAFDQPPVFIGLQALAPETALKPFALALSEGKLLVSYLSSDRVDEFSATLEYRRTLHLRDQEPASITGLALDGDRIYAADFNTGELLLVEYSSGKVLQAYGWMPSRFEPIKALGVTFFQNNLYVGDVASRKMLAIGALAEKDVRDEGELIVAFPNGGKGEFELGFPTASMVTPDGRLIVSDAKFHDVKAFTCSGRSAHRFDSEGEAALAVPMGIAMDSLPSPELLEIKSKVFDLSGVNDQGRIHVVDAGKGQVKVFNALGKYVLSYGSELREPNGIAIDTGSRTIFIADAALRALAIYKY